MSNDVAALTSQAHANYGTLSTALECVPQSLHSFTTLYTKSTIHFENNFVARHTSLLFIGLENIFYCYQSVFLFQDCDCNIGLFSIASHILWFCTLIHGFFSLLLFL